MQTLTAQICGVPTLYSRTWREAFIYRSKPLRGGSARWVDLFGTDGFDKVYRFQSPEVPITKIHKLTMANLRLAMLPGADLRGTNFTRSNLMLANMQGSVLRGANLQHADLNNANLQDTDLSAANLQAANLFYANLIGADLRGAYLQDADVRAAMLENAILPDGTRYTANIDMVKFVNVRHPDFAQTLQKIESIRKQFEAID